MEVWWCRWHHTGWRVRRRSLMRRLRPLLRWWWWCTVGWRRRSRRHWQCHADYAVLIRSSAVYFGQRPKMTWQHTWWQALGSLHQAGCKLADAAGDELMGNVNVSRAKRIVEDAMDVVQPLQGDVECEEDKELEKPASFRAAHANNRRRGMGSESYHRA